MPAIHLHHLSFQYTRAVDVLVDVDVHIGPGWTGVVGANGSGKTTLMRLVTGELEPSVGSVSIDPADASFVLCEQTVDEPSPEIEILATSWTGPDASLRKRLGLDVDQIQRWPSLSPGERKRWQIAAALSRRPGVLMLDEPTNHLDTDGLGLLIAELQRFDGVGLLVSHDRHLLEDLTVRTLRVDRGRVSLWNSSYETARAGWLAVESEKQVEHERLKREAKRAEVLLAEQRRVNERKRAAFKKRNNTRSFKDIDARSAARGNQHREGDKAAGKALATSAGKRDRAVDAVAAVEVAKELGGKVFVGFSPSPKRVVASHSGPLVAGDHLVREHVEMTVERSDRWWVKGANGAGKTTLLKSLVGSVTMPEEKVLHLEQELTAAQGRDLMRQVRSLSHADLGKVLSVVAALGVDPEVLLASDQPSPGELRKVAMALGLGRQAWLVVLDEPTNHLDIPSLERLEAALETYPGALVVATHDELFASRLNLGVFELS